MAEAASHRHRHALTALGAREANADGMPAYVAFQTSRTHVAHAGDLGTRYDSRHMGVPLDTTYVDETGRSRYVFDHAEPIGELF